MLSRQASGRLIIYFNAGVREVFDGYADLDVRGEVTRVPAELLFLKLGADAPRKFFESVGIRYTGDGKDARPILSPVHQSSVPGLFLIGAASGRDLIKLGMNQGWEVIEHLMGREVEPADEAVLKERLPFWEGSVRERIASIRSRVPLLAAADEQQLRETFLATRVRRIRQWRGDHSPERLHQRLSHHRHGTRGVVAARGADAGRREDRRIDGR